VRGPATLQYSRFRNEFDNDRSVVDVDIGDQILFLMALYLVLTMESVYGLQLVYSTDCAVD